MKEINIMEAIAITSPNPLTLICSEKPDGTVNLAPVGFFSYLSFNPPMIGFAMGKEAYTGNRIREIGKVIVTLPGTSLSDTVMSCGLSSGKTTDKVKEFGIELAEIKGSTIKIPTHTKMAIVATLKQTIEVGDHYLYICDVDKFLADHTENALFSWDGGKKIAPIQEK